MYSTIYLLRGVDWVSIKNEGNREIHYGNSISASRRVRITPGNLWIGRSNNKNGVYTNTHLLNSVSRVSIKNEGTRKINYGNCIAVSRPDRITPGTHCLGGSNDKNGF
jgi:hypothetical protein